MTVTYARQSSGPRPGPRVIDVSDLTHDAITTFVADFEGERYLQRRGDRTLLVVE